VTYLTSIMKFYVMVVICMLKVINSVECQEVDDYEEKCEPNLADACFDRVVQNIQCLALQGKTSSCINAASDLCSSIDDALQCTSDIIDTDCGKKEGRDNFDAWLKGLRAVYYLLCGKNEIGLLGMTQNAECWNPMTFIKCTEHMAGIDHINTLLKQKLDMNECNRLLISISTCNARATDMQNTRCTPSLENINEIIHIFFSSTECGRLCSSRNSAPLPKSSLTTIVMLLTSIVIPFL